MLLTFIVTTRIAPIWMKQNVVLMWAGATRTRAQQITP
jgi:hypothetical protein